MVEIPISVNGTEPKLPEDRLREEARCLYRDFFKTLLALSEFRESFIAGRKSSPGAREPAVFGLNGKRYQVVIGQKEWPYNALAVAEYETGAAQPARSLQIQLPIHGCPNRSSVRYVQFDGRLESLRGYSAKSDTKGAIQRARKFLSSLTG